MKLSFVNAGANNGLVGVRRLITTCVNAANLPGKPIGILCSAYRVKIETETIAIKDYSPNATFGALSGQHMVDIPNYGQLSVSANVWKCFFYRQRATAGAIYHFYEYEIIEIGLTFWQRKLFAWTPKHIGKQNLKSL